MSREIEFLIGIKDASGNISEVLLTIDELLDKGLKAVDCEIMYKRQFTGLLDCNGVKIFEMDILLNLDPIDYYPMLVKFEDGRFCVDVYQGWIVTVNDNYIKSNEMVIIGNIYQNPELLEQSK